MFLAAVVLAACFAVGEVSGPALAQSPLVSEELPFSPSNILNTDIPMADPASSLLAQPDSGLDPAFCARWNPDFGFRGAECCGKISWQHRRRGIRCSPQRSKESFCDEMTLGQQDYLRKVSNGNVKDVLVYLEGEFGRYGGQAVCEPSNGFLTWGRPLVSNDSNRIQIRRPGRCVNFGTDRMVAFLEWLGREVGKHYSAAEYSGLRLLVGDMSAPRGGCLAGHGGRKGHSSHMNGRDVDLGFLDVRSNRPSLNYFSTDFDADENWWLLKKIFANPYVCVDKILLDRRHIRKLNKVAAADPRWQEVRPHIRHVRGHHNHFHIRIGESPGAPGCP